MRAKAGGGAAGTASMAWVTEYDETFADEGTVDLKALTGSTWTDQYGVSWNVYCDAGVSAYGIGASGLGPSGTHSGAVYALIDADIEDMIAIGGGAAYDPHTDAIRIYIVHGTLTGLSTADDIAFASLSFHSGGNVQGGMSSNGSTTERYLGIDDNSAANTTQRTADASWSSGIIAIQSVGAEAAVTYAKNDTAADLDFDTLTAMHTQQWLSARVAFGVGNDDSPARNLSLSNALHTGAKEWRITRVVVQRYRAVLV